MARAAAPAFLDGLPPRYRVDRVLSEGEGGATLEVFDTGLRQAKAVVKIQRLSGDDAAQGPDADFRRFCARLSGVRHPNVACPYTFGTFESVSGGTFGYTTRAFVRGMPLSSVPLPVEPAAAVRVAHDICEGLDSLHAAGLCHSDLKLENVIVRRAQGGRIDELSECVLIDLSYRSESSHGVAALSEVSLQYLAPEMVEGEMPGPRADLYALGVLLYRLLAGRFPFRGESLPDIMRAQRGRDFVPLASLRPGIPPALRQLVERLLEPNPGNRPESAQAVMAVLHSVAAVAPGASTSAFESAGFVGREAELEESVAALRLDRFSVGVSCVEVRGPAGIGVTTFLREMQDRLEARGVSVLTARPRAASGVALPEGLCDAIHGLVRRGPAGASGIAGSAISSDLLDDLFVASKDRRVVLFVDDSRLCDVGEVLFLERLILQDRAVLGGPAGRSGRCQIVLGDSIRPPGDESHRDLDRHVGKRITLGPLSRSETAALLSAARPDLIHAAAATRVHEVTGGHAGRIRALLRHLEAAPNEGLDGALESAAGQPRDAAEDEERHRRRLALEQREDGDALLALCLWGDVLSATRWDALRLELGGSDLSDCPVDRQDLRGEHVVRTRHGDLADYLVRSLPAERRSRLAGAVLAVCRDIWRSPEPSRLLPMLRFIGRLGTIPPRCRWGVCRALILLLDRGCFSDIEAVTASLARDASAPWWVPLFREAARAGTGAQEVASSAPQGDSGDRPESHFRSWIRARGLLRARFREEAYRILGRLASVGTLQARTTRLALLEDHAMAAAEMGFLDEAVRLRREMLGLVAPWLPVLRRRRGGRSRGRAESLRQACRKVARYHRIRYRIHLQRRHWRRSIAACRRERLLYRVDGNLLREAACLNNEGIALIQSGKGASAAPVLERSVRLRERLDDERGLVIALNNLAAALSTSGRLGSATAVLNRARLVATRNGLARQRNLALLNLGGTYLRRGQLGEARRSWRQALRCAREEGDADALARATLNCAWIAVNRWSAPVAEAYIVRSSRLKETSEAYPRDLLPDLVRAEMAYRGRDWVHLHATVDRLRGQGVPPAETLDYEARLALSSDRPVPGPEPAVERQCSTKTRLRLILLRRSRGAIRRSSLGRVLALARAHGETREAVAWIVAHLACSADVTDESLATGLKALSWLEFREGQDDLQIELRALLAQRLRERGREAESWRLIEDALVMFRRLERRLRRWPRGMPLLLHLQALVQQALSGRGVSSRRGAKGLSAALCIEAFDLLVKRRRRGGGACEGPTDTLQLLGATLAEGADRGSFVDRLLDIGLGATGAQRAVLVTGRPGSQRVRRVRLAERAGGEGDREEISWAVVTQVVSTGRPSLFSDALSAEELASHRSIAVLKLRSLACVPLRAGGQILGALYLDHLGIAGLFTQETLGLLELLSGLIALTLHTSQMEDLVRRTRKELVETQRHLVRAERNRVTGEIAGGLVHDLKNVLAAVAGRTQLLRRATEDAQMLRGLDAIERATGSGVGLLQRLQECAREHLSQSEEVVDLAVIAQEALDLLSARLEKHGIATEVRASAPAQVRGVPGEFREMFLNLFVNACDAMPEGGRLSVDVETDAGHGQLVVRVADTGVGMSPATKSRIFEPFFTTKGSQGTGLGLVVVRNVVAHRGGAISVKSEVGAGTTFEIVLPLTALSRAGKNQASGAAH